MKRKGKYAINVCLPIFFLIYWFIYNYRYIKPENSLTAEEKIIIINSDSKGFFCYIIVSTFFTIIYLLYINFLLNKLQDFEIIRSGKIVFFKKQLNIICIQTLIYTASFELINVLMNYFCLPATLLHESKFIILSAIHFFLLYIYFLLVGALFILMNTIVSFKSISVWITAFVFCGLLGLSKLFHIEGLPIKDFCVFDSWYNGVLNISPIIISIIKNVITICICFLLAKNIFLTKDILANKSIKLN